jgi:hypothetical protein
MGKTKVESGVPQAGTAESQIRNMLMDLGADAGSQFGDLSGLASGDINVDPAMQEFLEPAVRPAVGRPRSGSWAQGTKRLQY